MRDSKSRTSWRRSKDGAGQERRAAGKAGDRGYEVLPVTAARTGTSHQRVAANPYWHLRCWGAKAPPRPVSKAASCSRSTSGRGQAGSCAHPLGLNCHNSPWAFRIRQGGYEGRVICSSLNRFKINTHHSNNPPTCPSLCSELRTHHEPILCAPEHAAVAGLSGFPGVSQSV